MKVHLDSAGKDKKASYKLFALLSSQEFTMGL